jgi:hypothetical protein
MIVTRDGRVPWSHMADNASDNAAIEEFLEAARRSAR